MEGDPRLRRGHARDLVDPCGRSEQHGTPGPPARARGRRGRHGREDPRGERRERGVSDDGDRRPADAGPGRGGRDPGGRRDGGLDGGGGGRPPGGPAEDNGTFEIRFQLQGDNLEGGDPTIERTLNNREGVFLANVTAPNAEGTVALLVRAKSGGTTGNETPP